MDLLTILTADYANIAVGDKLNVMGIFRSITAKQFPARHPTMHLVIKLAATLGEYGQERLMTIKLFEPDGDEILSYPVIIKVPEGKGGLRPEINAVIEMRDVIFPHPGRYEFVVLVDKDVKGTYSLEVIQAEPPASS